MKHCSLEAPFVAKGKRERDKTPPVFPEHDPEKLQKSLNNREPLPHGILFLEENDSDEHDTSSVSDLILEMR
uniref:Uncharacterized protein n=1 Tax=Oryza brachyantha TaxID=4533 RepID=J3M604_ORYBR